MAGSHVYQESSAQAALTARIDGLKILAHHVDEPVVIFNPRMELVYANPSAENLAGRCPLILAPQGENSHPDVIPIAHCEPCSGKQLFEDRAQNVGQIASVPPISTTAKSPCPLPRAVPLKEGEGRVQFAVLMGPRGRESVVLGPEEMIQRVAAGRDFRTPERGFT